MTKVELAAMVGPAMVGPADSLQWLTKVELAAMVGPGMGFNIIRQMSGFMRKYLSDVICAF